MDESQNEREDDRLARYTLQLARYTKWLMFAAVLSMAATIWIAYSTRQLRDFAEQQAGDMKTSLEMTRNAIFAGNRQAAAAETANDQARESAKIQLRAYVVQTSIETQNIISGNLTSIFHIKNVGQTPAINLGFAVHSEVVAPTNNVVPSYDFSKARDPSVATEI
jgi:HAMP domain-containing protein